MKKVIELRTKEQILAAIYAGQPVTVAELKTLNIGLIEAFEASNMTEEGFRAVQIDKQLAKNYETNYLPIPLMILPKEELNATKEGYLLEVLRINSEGKEEKIYKDGDYIKDGLKITLDESDIVVTAGRRRLSSLFTFGKKDTLVYFEVQNRAAVNMSNDAVSINSASEFSKLWAALKQNDKLDIGAFLKTLNVKDTSEAGTGANKKTNMTKLVRLLQHLENSDSVKFSRITEQVFANKFGYNALKNIILFCTPEQRKAILGNEKDNESIEYITKLGEFITKWFDYCEGLAPIKYGVTKGAKFDKFIELLLPKAPKKVETTGKIETFTDIKKIGNIDQLASTTEQEQLYGSIHKFVMTLEKTPENLAMIEKCYEPLKGQFKVMTPEFQTITAATEKWLKEKQATKEKSIFNTLFKEVKKEGGATDTELNATFYQWLKKLDSDKKVLILDAITNEVGTKKQNTSAAVIDLNENF